MITGFKFLIPIVVLATLACSLGVQGVAQVPPQNLDRPQVILLAPPAQSPYGLGVPILLHAEARDLNGGISKIEFYDNFEAVIGTVNSTTPQGDPQLTAIISWQPPSAQTHFVRVKAFRADGTESNTAEISVEVVALPEGFSANPAPPIEIAPTAEGGSATESQTAAEIEAPPVVENQPSPETAENSPTVTSLPATITIELTNVRVSPSVSALPAMQPLQAGAQVELAWRTADSQWVATPLATGGYGWIFAVNTMTIEGDINSLPVATTE